MKAEPKRGSLLPFRSPAARRTAIKTNALYYGDNLEILREYFPDESVDLVYLDPPFNSNQSYNVIFKDESGRKSDGQQLAFEDTWHWGPVADARYAYLTETLRHHGTVPDAVTTIIGALCSGLGKNQMMAYLVEMTVRLVELRRVLKPTGSLYLHCDPTASHYLKVVLDAVFGVPCFRNEITWHYSGWNKKLSDHYESRHDVILFYAKAKGQNFPGYTLPWASEDEYIRVRKQKVLVDKNGEAKRKYVLSDAGNGTRVKRYLDEAMSYGRPLDDVWDIDKINNSSKEAVGYPTQKPMALLERIIASSTSPGDVVLDPFCGCGTALIAAESLGRRWVGIDLTYLAVGVMSERLKRDFQITDVEVIGQPTELAGARQLAEASPGGRYQFQWWALGLIGAESEGGLKRKGADRGIDGRITFTGEGGGVGSVLVSVKSGHVSSAHVRDLKGTLEREYAAMGIFLTLEEPTREMRREASMAGMYRVRDRDYPKIQIITVRELLEEHQKPLLPPLVLTTDGRTGRLDV